jgi:hypothetical protein
MSAEPSTDIDPQMRGGVGNRLVAHALTRLGGSIMARIWKTPLFVLATAYFVLDGLFSYVTRPFAAWLGRMQIFERMRRWIVSLRPYPSLALFALPVIILEPVKPLAGYFVATGHLVTGAMTFLTGEVLKLTCVERLFELNRKKLLSIPAFAAGYRQWRRMMDLVESLEVWKASRRLASRAAQIVRLRWHRLKRAQESNRESNREPDRGSYRLQ